MPLPPPHYLQISEVPPHLLSDIKDCACLGAISLYWPETMRPEVSSTYPIHTAILTEGWESNQRWIINNSWRAWCSGWLSHTQSTFTFSSKHLVFKLHRYTRDKTYHWYHWYYQPEKKRGKRINNICLINSVLGNIPYFREYSLKQTIFFEDF